MQNQSLGTSGPWVDTITREWTLARAEEIMPGGALMLGGLYNVDGQPLYTDGPRSKAYDEAIPSTGLTAALPPAGDISAPFPLAVSMNVMRARRGLPLVPIVTTAHGIAGVDVLDIDDDPATGSGSTLIWDNMDWWYDEVVRVCAAAGLKAWVSKHA